MIHSQFCFLADTDPRKEGADAEDAEKDAEEEDEDSDDDVVFGLL